MRGVDSEEAPLVASPLFAACGLLVEGWGSVQTIEKALNFPHQEYARGTIKSTHFFDQGHMQNKTT